MFPKFDFKNSSTLTLVAFAVLTSCNCAVAQSSVSIGQIRSLPAIDTDAHQEASKAKRLFTINEQKSLPPVSQFNKARIVSAKSLVPPGAQSYSNTEPPASSTVADQPIAHVAMAKSNATDNASPAIVNSSPGYYTVSFAQPNKQPQSDEDLAGFSSEEELDSPTLGQLETNEAKATEAAEDLEDSEEDDPDLSNDDLEDILDDEINDEFDDGEDDSPIARPEFGPWPSKSIQAVRLDMVEYDAEAPEDRASKLFESSRRFDGNIAATDKVFAWAAPNIKYQPLYFEDVALERYGQTKGLVKQPFVSAGRFLADKLLLVPRAMRVCPHSCDSPLGYCRPGSPSTIANGDSGCACQNGTQEDCQSCR